MFGRITTHWWRGLDSSAEEDPRGWRRESADVVLRFPTISGSHCELVVEEGIGLYEISTVAMEQK